MSTQPSVIDTASRQIGTTQWNDNLAAKRTNPGNVNGFGLGPAS
jgi:hypothetical protein